MKKLLAAIALSIALPTIAHAEAAPAPAPTPAPKKKCCCEEMMKGKMGDLAGMEGHAEHDMSQHK